MKKEILEQELDYILTTKKFKTEFKKHLEHCRDWAENEADWLRDDEDAVETKLFKSIYELNKLIGLVD